jgi:hypothetical protein
LNLSEFLQHIELIRFFPGTPYFPALGIMEYWKNGIMGHKMEKVIFGKYKIPLNPIFHHSIIPIGAKPLSS